MELVLVRLYEQVNVLPVAAVTVNTNVFAASSGSVFRNESLPPVNHSLSPTLKELVPVKVTVSAFVLLEAAVTETGESCGLHMSGVPGPRMMLFSVTPVLKAAPINQLPAVGRADRLNVPVYRLLGFVYVVVLTTCIIMPPKH